MTSAHLRRFRRNSPWMAGLTMLGLLMSPSPTGAQKSASAHTRAADKSPLAADEARYDPRAALLLKRMGEAYSRLSAFDLHINVSKAPIPLEALPDSSSLSKTNVDPTPFQPDESKLSPQTQLHLAFRSSNRLLMETQEQDYATGKTFDLRWVSDGRQFWSYTGDKNIYTREKAPGSIHDFARLQYLNSGTLELMMLIGPNPFADLQQTVEGSHLVGEADVRGIPTQVVSLQMEDPIARSEMRLYIGKADNLLYRMEIEAIPVIPREGPIKLGSKLDALLDKPNPIKQDDIPDIPGVPKLRPPDPPKPRKPIGSFTRYENDLTLSPNFPNDTFTFTPPKGSLMLGGDPAPTKHLTTKQRIAMLAKNAREQREAMLRNGEN